MKNRSFIDNILLFIKGLLMGVANKVPGVSGGMVSFVFNFYEEMGGNVLEIIYLLVRLEYVEYMNGSLDAENPKTNIIFKNTISDVLEAELP